MKYKIPRIYIILYFSIFFHNNIHSQGLNKEKILRKDISPIFKNIKNPFDIFILNSHDALSGKNWKKTERSALKKFPILNNILLLSFHPAKNSKFNDDFHLYFIFYEKKKLKLLNSDENAFLEVKLKQLYPGSVLISLSESFPFYFNNKLYPAKLLTWDFKTPGEEY